LFIENLLSQLRRFNVDLSQVTIQTDNGSEFIGSWNKKKESNFTEIVEKFGARHATIKVRAHRWQADVETMHRLVEDEFFEVEKFFGRKHFIYKASYVSNLVQCFEKKLLQRKQNSVGIDAKKKIAWLNPKIAILIPFFIDSIDGVNYYPHRPLLDHHLVPLPYERSPE